MAYITYHTTDRDRVCKICDQHMARHTWGILIRDVHISPRIRDIHFHEGCFMRSLDAAKKEWGNKPLNPVTLHGLLPRAQIYRLGSRRMPRLRGFAYAN